MKRTLFLLLCFVSHIVLAQGTSPNGTEQTSSVAFRVGEKLSYDLYFKYGLVYAKAGFAEMSIAATPQNNLCVTLISHSTGAARKIFKLEDTLQSVMNRQMQPLRFEKYAHEGDSYTIDKQVYSYHENGASIQTTRVKNGRQRYDEVLQTDQPTFDMLSVVFYARTLDYASLQQVGSFSVSFLSGKKHLKMDIRYDGVSRIKANNGQRYECLKLTMVIRDDAFANPQEAMKVWITNDKNRVPMQIESKLRVGSSRVVLKDFEGLAN